MRYEQDENGFLIPICETREEELWFEAIKADNDLLWKRMREAPSDEARQAIINEWCHRDDKIYTRVTGEFIRRAEEKRLSEN